MILQFCFSNPAGSGQNPTSCSCSQCQCTGKVEWTEYTIFIKRIHLNSQLESMSRSLGTYPIILSASTLRNSGSQATRPLCSTSTPSPRKTANILSAHIGNWLDRDRKGDWRRQFTIVGHNLLCHGITHFLQRTFKCNLMWDNLFQSWSNDLMDVDTFWPKFTVAHSPVLLAWYSLVLHGWSLLLLGLILLHLLGCWLLQVSSNLHIVNNIFWCIRITTNDVVFHR